MTLLRSVTMAMIVTGTILVVASPSLAEKQSATDRTSKVESGASGKSAGSSSKDGRIKKQRRSSGKGIVEERTDGKSHNKSQESSDTPGTTLKFGSGGGGVTGATGK